MKNIDALLKKVELFERLAVYGDRKSFLQALAQDASAEELNNLLKDFTAIHPENTKIQNALMDAANGKLSPEELRWAIQSARDAVPGTRMDLWNKFNNYLNTVTTETREEELAPSRPLYMTPEHISAYPVDPNVKKVQQFLNKQLTQGGDFQASMPPIAEDGKRGPETNRALKLWQEKNNLPDLNSAYSNALAASNKPTAQPTV